jgi:hypothetical protein
MPQHEILCEKLATVVRVRVSAHFVLTSTSPLEDIGQALFDLPGVYIFTYLWKSVRIYPHDDCTFHSLAKKTHVCKTNVQCSHIMSTVLKSVCMCVHTLALALFVCVCCSVSQASPLWFFYLLNWFNQLEQSTWTFTVQRLALILSLFCVLFRELQAFESWHVKLSFWITPGR